MVDRNPSMHKADGVALKDYIDAKFDAICRELEAGGKTMDARLHGMNEFRRAMEDQQRAFITKEEYRLAHKPVEEDIKVLRDFMATMRGKASQNAVIFASAVALLGLLLSVIGLIFKFN